MSSSPPFPALSTGGCERSMRDIISSERKRRDRFEISFGLHEGDEGERDREKQERCLRKRKTRRNELTINQTPLHRVIDQPNSLSQSTEIFANAQQPLQPVSRDLLLQVGQKSEDRSSQESHLSFKSESRREQELRRKKEEGRDKQRGKVSSMKSATTSLRFDGKEER